MSLTPAQTVFPASARAMQDRFGSRAAYARIEERFARAVDARLSAFLAGIDSFYLATATADAQPYVQHRGGPKGFLKVLGTTRLGFADFAGNQQYITIGRLAENDAVCLFVMDYARQARVKLWGRARVFESDAALIEQLADPDYPARVERAIIIDIDAWSMNCHQHIPRKFDAVDVEAAIATLENRVATLKAENAMLRDQLAGCAAPPA